MRTKLSLAAGAALLVLTGCSAAENVASDAADAASARAKQEAQTALNTAIQGQVCNVIGDSSLSDADLTKLSQLIDQADAAGLDSEVLQPVRNVVSSGEAKAADVRALQQNCN